jgi:uncharacterized protein
LPNVEQALCDTGPLVACFDADDSAHEECRAVFGAFEGRLVTTWAVLAEVFHLLPDRSHRTPLWQFILGAGIEIAEVTPADLPRMRSLMDQYADLPMDLADASLVVLSERLKVRRVFSLDRRDFLVYRPRHVRAFEVFP